MKDSTVALKTTRALLVLAPGACAHRMCESPLQLAFEGTRLRWIVLQPHCQMHAVFVVSTYTEGPATAPGPDVAGASLLQRRERRIQQQHACSTGLCTCLLLCCCALLPSLWCWYC